MADLSDSPQRSPKRKLSSISCTLTPRLKSDRDIKKKEHRFEDHQQYSCNSEHVWQRYFSTSPATSSTNGCLRLNRPCPACSRPISISQGGSSKEENEHMAFEVQHVIPWGAGADRKVDNWNLIPLCSRHRNDDDMDDQDQDQDLGWGCSERLERAEQHAFDWMREHYPLRLQEMCMRLQLAHGESFSLPAGDSLCLRFVRDVYGVGRARTGDVDPESRNGAWALAKCGFNSDLLDLAECFSEMTDMEMLRVIDMKAKLATPRASRRRGGQKQERLLSPSPLISGTTSSRVTLASAVCSSGSMRQPGERRKLFNSSSTKDHTEHSRNPDSDDDSDYRSADSDDESSTDGSLEGERDESRASKRLRTVNVTENK